MKLPAEGKSRTRLLRKELSASKPGPYDWYKMLSKAGKRSGAEAAQLAIVRLRISISKVVKWEMPF